MSEFVAVARVEDMPDPGSLVVEVNEQLVALFHVAGNFWATDDVCTHDGGTLAEGRLEGYAIACPRHGAKFDIRDGRALTMPAVQPTRVHEVKVAEGQVFVRLSE